MQILKQLKKQARNKGLNGAAEVSHDAHGKPWLKIHSQWLPCDGYEDAKAKADNLGYTLR